MTDDDNTKNLGTGGIKLNRVVESTSSEWIKQALEGSEKERMQNNRMRLQIISQYWANQFASNQLEMSQISSLTKSEDAACDENPKFEPNSSKREDDEGVWYSELKDYGLQAGDFKQNACNEEVGIAYASNPEDGKTYVVSTYIKSTAFNDEISNMLNGSGKMGSKFEVPVPVPPRRKKMIDSSGHDILPEAPPRLKRLSSIFSISDEHAEILDEAPKHNFVITEICNSKSPIGSQDHAPLQPVESKARDHRPEVPPKPKKPVIPPRQRRQSPPLKTLESDMD